MDILLDDRPIMQDADSDALELALARFKNLGHKRLTLRAEPKRTLTVSRWDGDLFVEVETPSRLDGLRVDGWEAVLRCARDYFAGKAVKLAWEPPPGVANVVMRDASHPDCPLCRKGA